MKSFEVDEEEKDILDAIERDELVSVPFGTSEIKRLKDIAKNTFAKTRSINIRISERDLIRLKAKALKEGLPYQTFISSVLRKEASQV